MKKNFLSKKYANPLFVIASVLFLHSCVSTSESVSPLSQEVREPVSNSVPKKVEEKEVVYVFDSREIVTLYVDVLKEQASGKNLEKINALLRKGKRNHLEQAVLVINLLQNFLVSHAQVRDDLEMPTQKSKMASLADLSTLYKIDLVELVEDNPFLQSVEVYHLLLRVKEYASSEEASSLIANTIQNKLDYFKEFVDLITATLKEENFEEEEDEGVVEVKRVNLRAKSKDLLTQAEELLARDRYNQAIDLLKQVKKSDRSYESAQQKIVSVSNRAVEDLRRQAALAYQKANHINTDFEARGTYLIEARGYLKKALELYPNAEHIAKVKQHLKVIDDNIDFLKKGRR
jgi:hypothetical protein